MVNERLVIAHMGYAAHFASKYAARYGGMLDFEELRGIAFLALVEAGLGFIGDPVDDKHFLGYARTLIVRAIVDAIRSELGRDATRKYIQLHEEVECEDCFRPTDDRIDIRTGLRRLERGCQSRRVIELILEGHTSLEIRKELGLTEHTYNFMRGYSIRRMREVMV